MLFQEVGVVGYFFVAFTTVAFVEFAGCSLDNLFVTLLDSVEFVMMRSNFVKVLAGYLCCNFRDCGSFVQCCQGAAK